MRMSTNRLAFSGHSYLRLADELHGFGNSKGFSKPVSVGDKSPMRSLRHDRQAEIGFRQGVSLAEISSSSAFMILLCPRR
jgi:hypothetical protein